jgi:hypothetical protein
MILHKNFRPVAVLALAVGLFLALPGCGGSKPSADGKDKKGDNPNPPPNPPPNTGTIPTSASHTDPNLPRPPEKINTTAGVGKDAVDFLSAVGAGTAKASQLSTGFLKGVGLPVELQSDKAKGYSADAAEHWLREVGKKLTGMGPMAESSQAGDVAVFRGQFIGGTYSLRMVKEGDSWKVDWLSLSSVNPPPAGAAPSADALLQGFAATAISAAVCDKDATPKDERIAVIAAGLTPAFRTKWADPFDGDKAKGYDYSPAKLAVKVGEIGNGADAVSISPAGDATFKAEVTKAGGAKAAYIVRLAKGTSPGQWLVESITPQ